MSAPLNLKKTTAISLGYFSVNLTLCLYGPLMPLLLSRFTDSKFTIGLATMLGYIIAAAIQPWFGNRSDLRPIEKGRRLPFLAVGMPLTALFFLLLPFANSMALLIVGILLFNLAISVFRVPVMSLMPDQTPKEHWSTANGIVNFMGGIGALIAYFLGSMLFEKGRVYPFLMTAVLLLVCLLLLRIFVKEKEGAAAEKGEAEQETKVRLKEAFLGLLRKEQRTNRCILLSIFFRFVGYNGIETFFALYLMNMHNLGSGKAGIFLGILALSFIITAIPSGILGEKLGRRRSILMGLLFMTGVFILDAVTGNFTVMLISAPLGGFGYALVNINAFPFLLENAPAGNTGTYTGLYYFFFSLASIIAPPFFGKLMDLFGMGILFHISTVMLVLAVISFLFIPKGARQEGGVEHVS